MDTTTRKCKKCEEEFDSIFEIDNGICDECKDELEKTLLIYIVYRNELQLKCKRDSKIASERQLHEYAFERIVLNS